MNIPDEDFDAAELDDIALRGRTGAMSRLYPLVDSATLVLTKLVTGAKSKFVETR